ncbi:MAG: choice-of-anchor J domain-containing protein [Phycisphaerae bacterium]
MKRVLALCVVGLFLAGVSNADLTLNESLGTLVEGSYNLTGTTVGMPTNCDFYDGCSYNESLGEYVYSFTIGATMNISMTSVSGVGGDNDQFLLDSLVTYNDGTYNRSANMLSYVDENGGFGQYLPGTYYLSVDTYNNSTEGLYDITLTFEEIVQLQYVWFHDFEGGLPAGWTVVENGDVGGIWKTNTEWSRANEAGAGLCMDADSDAFGTGSKLMDTELVTPMFNVPADATFEFDQYYRHLGTSYGDVDINDGRGWVNLLHQTASSPQYDHQSLDLSAYAGQDVQIRFHFDDNAEYDWYWEVDNVGVTPEPAALLLLAVAGLALRRR